MFLGFLSLCWLTGTVTVLALPDLPPPNLWAPSVAGVAVLAALGALRLSKLWGLVFFLVSAGWTAWQATRVLDDALGPTLEGEVVLVQGRVVDLPRTAEGAVRFVLRTEHAWQAGRPVRVPRLIQIGAHDARFHPRPGERWRLAVRLKQPHGLSNPGGFDHEAHLFERRIRATGTVRREPPPHRIESAGWSLDGLRAALSTRIARALTGDPFSGMVTAFANGDTSGLTGAQWETLRVTGTTHLIAISGMNVGFVAGLAFVAGRWLWSRSARAVLWLAAPRAGAVIAWLAGAGYSALAGFSIPTQRALVMLSLVLGGRCLLRRFSVTQALSLALIAVLLFDPLSVLARGFWLSFLAVCALAAATPGAASRANPGVDRDPEGTRGPVSWLKNLAAAQGWVTMVMLPVMVFLFSQVSVVAPLTNLLAIPVIEGMVIPATLFGVACLPLADAVGLPFSGLAFKLATAGLRALWFLLEPVGRWEHAVFDLPAPPLWVLGAAGAGVVLWMWRRDWPARAAGLLCLLPMFVVRPPAPGPGELWATVLDVGQGLSVVLRTEHHIVIYDTGPRFGPHHDAGRTVLVPFLRQSGVRHVDLLILSHDDLDHVGGAASLIARYPPRRILAGQRGKFPGATPCEAGQQQDIDGVLFEFLHPPPGHVADNDNASSCVLRVANRAGSMLITGDIPAAVEDLLVAGAGGRIRSDVLIVPHHGSKTSSSEAFLDTVAPRVAVVTAGYLNRYRHPHPDVVARYRKRAIEWHETVHEGTVELRFGRDLKVRAHRIMQPRLWAPYLSAPTPAVGAGHPT